MSVSTATRQSEILADDVLAQLDAAFQSAHAYLWNHMKMWTQGDAVRHRLDFSLDLLLEGTFNNWTLNTLALIGTFPKNIFSISKQKLKRSNSEDGEHSYRPTSNLPLSSRDS